MNRGAGLGGIAAVIIAVWFITAGVQALTDNTTEDDAAWPCEYYSTALGDFRDGIITVTEFRARIVEVNDRAIIATERIQLAARALLSQVTVGTSPAQIAGALGELRAACSAAGVSVE